jgi:hypothetical protein
VLSFRPRHELLRIKHTPSVGRAMYTIRKAESCESVRLSPVTASPRLYGVDINSGKGTDLPDRTHGQCALDTRDARSKRAKRLVGVPPGGTLSDYVPFYFTPYSIVMYNIKTGYGVKQVPNEDIVIFVSSLPHVEAQGVRFVFTNQHAYPPMADYFTDLAELDQIDWPLLRSRDFEHDPDDPGKKERYQAEALIWKHVPLQALRGVCCYTPAVEQQVKAEIERRALSFQVGVQRSWYFL